MRRAIIPIFLAGLAFGAVSCGSDSDSKPASEQVCEDRDDLDSAVDVVKDDVAKGDFSGAKEDFAAVNTAIDDLKVSAGDLESQEQDQLAPRVNQIKQDLQDIASKTPDATLASSLQDISLQLQLMTKEINSALDCP